VTPETLKLKNFVGIKSGLGRDELTLDLTAMVPDDAELVAFVGPNGKGKSTIIDSLTPFRIMPSRAGGYSPGSFSYFEQTYGTDARKELVWTHAGVRYKSTIILKMPGKTKTQQAYLFQKVNDDWISYTAPDGTVSDSKTSTYDACLETIIGTPQMFFTSAFSCQNRQSLSTYTNGEIKGLLAELLGLDHVRELGQKANNVAKSIQARFEAMRVDLERVASAEQEIESTQPLLDDERSLVAVRLRERQDARKAVQEATRALADVEAQSNAHADIEARRSDLRKNLSDERAKLNGSIQDVTTDIRAEESNAQVSIAQSNADIEAARNTLSQLEQQIQRQQAILARKAEIDQAKAESADLVAAVTSLETEAETARTQAEEYRAKVNESGKMAERLNALKREGEQVGKVLKDLEERAGLTDTVPCKGSDLQDTCPLLSHAMAAKQGIPERKEALEAKRGEYRSGHVEYVELKAVIDTMGDPEAVIRNLDTGLRDARQAVGANSATLAMADSVEQAGEAIEAAESQMAALQERIASTSTRIDEIRSACEQRVSDLQERKARITRESQQAIATVTHELDSMPPAETAQATEAAQQAANEADQALHVAEQRVESSNTSIAGFEAQITALTRQLAEADDLKADAGRLEAEIAYWSLLAKALSNDGIIALAIDDAGPTLSSLANDLLLECFGPRFSVRIDTQQETAKGDLRESFDITVFDCEADTEKSVSDMSGGERVWIESALMRAIALYQAETAGIDYEVLLSDESDGALDPEKKLEYLKMKRAVLRIGGYQREYFISHTEALQEQADAVIDLEVLAAA